MNCVRRPWSMRREKHCKRPLPFKRRHWRRGRTMKKPAISIKESNSMTKPWIVSRNVASGSSVCRWPPLYNWGKYYIKSIFKKLLFNDCKISNQELIFEWISYINNNIIFLSSAFIEKLKCCHFYDFLPHFTVTRRRRSSFQNWQSICELPRDTTTPPSCVNISWKIISKALNVWSKISASVRHGPSALDIIWRNGQVITFFVIYCHINDCYCELTLILIFFQ